MSIIASRGMVTCRNGMLHSADLDIYLAVSRTGKMLQCHSVLVYVSLNYQGLPVRGDGNASDGNYIPFFFNENRKKNPDKKSRKNFIETSPKCFKYAYRRAKIARLSRGRSLESPSVLFPFSCLRHLWDALSISWPYQFFKTGYSPAKYSTRFKSYGHYSYRLMQFIIAA